MQFIVKLRNMKDGQNILQLAIPLNVQRRWHSFTYGSFTLMWNDFSLGAATNLKEREIFLNEPVSTLLKLVYYFKHLSCN